MPTLIRPWSPSKSRQLPCPDVVASLGVLAPLRIDQSFASGSGDIDYRCISYKSDLVPWLRGCQKRAYEEPALRESVAQYLRLIGKLTGTDFSEAYMNDLKELCLKDNNLVLVHDLSEAMIEAKISLLAKL